MSSSSSHVESDSDMEVDDYDTLHVAPYLRPDFDPKNRSVKITDLKKIFIDHGINYGRAKTKADYIELFEQQLRPQVPRLLAEAKRVRASSAGIEDRRLPAPVPESSKKPKARKPLVPPPRQSAMPSSVSTSRLSGEPAVSSNNTMAKSRKNASMNNLAAVADSSSASTSGKNGGRNASAARRPSVEPPAATRRMTRRSVSVEVIQSSDDEELSGGMDVVEEQKLSAKHSARPSTSRKVSQKVSSKVTAPMVIDEDEEDELAEDSPPEAHHLAPAPRQSTSVSPARRPVVEIPVPVRRQSDLQLESPQKRKIREVEGINATPSGFSDFNPFQSSPDSEEAKLKRRRKSSMGVKREEVTEPTSIKRSKTLSDLATSGTPHATPSTLSRKGKSSLEAPPTDGLERFRRKISGTPDQLPTPLKRTLSPPQPDSDVKRPSFAALATAPEDFHVNTHSPPRKQKSVEHSHAYSQAAEASISKKLVELERRSSSPEPLEDGPIYQSGADWPTDEEEEDSVVVASISSAQAPRDQPEQVQIKTPPKKGPAPQPASQFGSQHALVPVTKKGGSQAAAHIARKTAQASGLTLTLLLLTALFQTATIWANGKKALGFCDTGLDTNNAVISRHTQSGLVQQRHLDYSDWREFVELAKDFVEPTTCTPCPDQAVCENGEVTACNKGYIQQPNPITNILAKNKSPRKSVLPLLLPPRCAPDTAYLQRVFEVATQTATDLRSNKGEVICSGHKNRRTREAKKLDIHGHTDAWVYGVRLADLKTRVRDQLEIGDWEKFDRMFNEALEYLSNHTELVRASAGDEEWIATNAADMPLLCRARLAGYSALNEHKGLVALLSALLSLLGYGRQSIKHRRQIAGEVEELVPLSLSLLQAQEQNYNMRDPMTPYPYLAPAQLRDLVLRDERSSARKAELWSRVEKVVESNANVRARTAEQHGEEVRVWQWVGGAYDVDLPVIEGPTATPGTAASSNRRRSLAPRSSLSRGGTPRTSLGERHISWDEEVTDAKPNVHSVPYY